MTDRFLYVTYIRTTPEKLFEALTTPEFNKQFWMGNYQESDWKVGSPWRIQNVDGKVWDSGEVLEFDPPRRYAVSWTHHVMPEVAAEGASRATFVLEPMGEVVKLTVTHEIENGPNFIAAVSGGWPMILSNLKTLLETGQTLPAPAAT
jgi:uncharacterized protein YndB with AHSA1/START domain